MPYPVKMHNPALVGFAVANSAAEHRSLSAAGYLPRFVEEAADTLPAAPDTVTGNVSSTHDSGAAIFDPPAVPEKRKPGRPRKVQA